MNREAKRAILTAYGKGIISKVEALHLFKSDGKILLDLSRKASPNPINETLEKIPDLIQYFTPLLSLGHGQKPEPI